jgi:hypothetical protein
MKPSAEGNAAWGGRAAARISFVCLASIALLLASSGVVILLSANQVSLDSASTYRWEPAAASGQTWAHAWLEFSPAPIASYVSTWNGSWGNRTVLTATNGQPTVDVNLSWDPARERFVVAFLDNSTNHSVWYGYSNDSGGTSWTVVNVAPFVGGENIQGLGAANWDYPSVAVDASGRVIIGAVYFVGGLQQEGYWTVVSTDGADFSAPARVGSDPGRESRVVATDSVFEAFIPLQNSGGLNTEVRRWESSDGVAWTGPISIGMVAFSPPLNNTPTGSSYPILFFAPLLAATGYTNGLWAVAFPVLNGSYNNIVLCASNRGCGIVNSAGDVQFLAGVSVSGDAGYWVNYYTYESQGSYTPPLITQALYFPQGQSGIGATTNSNIDPTSWDSHTTAAWTTTVPRCNATPRGTSTQSRPTLTPARARPSHRGRRISTTCSSPLWRIRRAHRTSRTSNRTSSPLPLAPT